MPELPEVESVRLGLAPMIGRRVESARLFRRDILAMGPYRALGTAMLEGCLIERIERVGKQLALIATQGHALGIHLGMTGQVRLSTTPDPRGIHDHARWTLEGGLVVTFRDPRRFGGLRAASSAADVFAGLGPDALDVDAEHLHRASGKSTRPIKAALLDQAVLAGVGNIYADESLFRAGIRPKTRCHQISARAWKALAESVRWVLGAALERGGSTLRDYRKPDGQTGQAQQIHRVYGRGGLPCVNCGQRLRCGTVSQRTTVWCAECQT